MKRTISIIIFTLILVLTFSNLTYAQSQIPLFGKTVKIEDSKNPENYVTSIQILILLTVLTLAPSILIMMTSFTRIIIVLSFIRNALGLQQTPPNQVLIGLALFLTFFIMAPIGSQINDNAIQPFLKEEINQEVAYKRAMEPVREFMFKQTRDKDLALFMNVAKMDNVKDLKEIPDRVIIPAFIISELKTAFEIGFVIYIPFLVIDMVVSSTLMSMGMMMLPPVIISLPFKILLFILVDGWNLIAKSLVLGFK
ncbi:flagellar type III secretion system pore protein FliP [Sporanaerobacter acetigenes]|uniref:Flagellar biosynthetic protein FliP n=1 Tax=Sporanaerobacter acetigenes DSM 13106 TaxID=1123281 RepID=A0A1M5XJD6_9FIRM|nr:flagellar type III secretion system pore protein FliP [Sporanaerobacter acetigenes]SHH99383.1 flagellar biosynthetic protein FliP [Sporanaerobacter acetigenes DSM 13106]